MAKIALLLVAHGSRRPEANADLDWLADLLRRDGRYHHVQPSFLELTTPTISDGGSACVAAGADRIIMVPYFLSPGVHAIDDLKEACRALQDRFPECRFALADPLGRHPLLADVVRQRVEQCGSP